jgi:hypothetical protein
MKYRTAELLAAEDQTSGAGTKTIDLKGLAPISRIIIQWIITKTANAMWSYCHKDITKIELVDGSDVLHSLDGGQNQALCIYDRKCPTMNHGQYINANSQRSSYGIDFGRFLGDPLLAFDPMKFNNPQLKITFDEDVSDTGATSNSLAVWAECFDEKVITPVGFLSAKNFESWVLSTAAAYHYLDLPTDLIIRKMLIQGYLKAYEPWYQVAEAKLSEDNDKRIPFDWNLEKYHQIRKGIDPPVTELVRGYGITSGTPYYLTPTDYWANFQFTPGGTQEQHYQDQPGRGGYFLAYCSTDREIHAVAQGWLPNHCFQFPFGDQQDIEDWYDVTKIGSLRLRLKSGSGSTGNVDTILQQLRPY